MASIQDADLVMINEDSVYSSTATSIAAGRDGVVGRYNSSGSSVTVATEGNGGNSSSAAITARLHIIPNIVDGSDAESVVDNNHPIKSSTNTADMNLIPDIDLDIINNLDKGSAKVIDDKYLIPDMPDLFHPHKPTSTNTATKTSVIRDHRYSLPGMSMSRSESVSSLTSEASLPAEGRRGLTPTEGGARAAKHRSNKRRRSSLNPRIKSKFGEATIQYIKDRLQGRLFSGWLEERHRLETMVSSGGEVVDGWRDVVEVDGCEVEMMQQLHAVIASVPGAKEGTKWINITAPTVSRGYLLWLLLEGPRPPGHYWFHVTDVQPNPTMGLHIQLSILRSVDTRDSETAAARTRRLAVAAATAAGDVPLGLTLAWQGIYDTVRATITTEAIRQNAAVVLTPTNVAYGIKVVVLALVSMVVGVTHACREAARLLLQLMNETGRLIDRATPLMQTLLGFVEKIVGGFFLLIAMVYKDVRRPTNMSGPALHSSPPQQAIRGRRGSGPRDWAAPNYGSARRYVAPEDWED